MANIRPLQFVTIFSVSSEMHLIVYDVLLKILCQMQHPLHHSQRKSFLYNARGKESTAELNMPIKNCANCHNSSFHNLQCL